MRVLRGGRRGKFTRWYDHLGEIETDRTVFLAMAELRRRAAEPSSGVPAHTPLTPWELRVFSQNGEDGVIDEILRRVGSPTRTFVEFGIESGREGNAVYLADVGGWDGLFIEADGEMFARLSAKYRTNPRVRTTQARVTTANIERLIADAEIPEEFDLLSIDVDGQDYWIWEAITAYRPRAVVIEYNSSLDPDRQLVQPASDSGWDGTAYMGSSLGALAALGERKGYRLVHTELAGVNAFFVRADLADGRFPDAAHVPRRSIPNYVLAGYEHPPDEAHRAFKDLEREPREPPPAGPASP